ncbi:deoxynucleoside monophosphate kinase [Salmonella phage STP4-a]|uniref:Deoxynucleoside monophosphate kinase n=1 Tax=Salmonella phage STP4-a TaxID=1445860 RepID=A0A0B4L9I3_9CAUD|nr:deoxynucleoside monophosphate kinase [Salmonella phage STP4-a]AHJ86986.1 deoxynucleoside monophosphate kinase [Salmonella phage STP4-a]
MKLIFLIGKKRSGKDTTADYIMENYGAIKHQLAGPIKDALCYAYQVAIMSKDVGKLFPVLYRSDWEGIDYDREVDLKISKVQAINIIETAMSWLNDTLSIKNAYFYNGYIDHRSLSIIKDTINSIEDEWSVRRLMQTLGTDIMVNHFDRMYWVKWFSLVYLDNFGKNLDYFIVPDTRQDHELDAARAMGATVIHVVRPSSVNSKVDTHITEAGLPIKQGDTVITNDGSLEELYAKIKKVLK